MRFEHRITLIYLILGVLWILFSDLAVESMAISENVEHNLQTYKGWLYVLITGLVFFVFMRRHLIHLRATEIELAQHKNKLEEKVKEQTQSLDRAFEELNKRHQSLQEKNELINEKNEELEAALRELKAAQLSLMRSEKLASLVQLTKGLSHEINNPLNYISGGLVALEDQKVDQINDESQLAIRSIRLGLDRVSRMIRSLNLMSDPEAKGEAHCDPQKVIRDILKNLKMEFPFEAEIENKTECDCYQVNANDAELYQVFYHVIKNAYQAVPTAGGKIKIEAEGSEKGCRFKISDNGKGIPQEDLGKITDPFFTTREAGQGQGLGLSIAYTILERHGAKLDIYSKPNEGTEVTIEMPK